MTLAYDQNSLFYAACGGVILGIACTLNYVIRGKDTGMTRIAFNLATMNTSQLHEITPALGGIFTMSSIIYLIYGNGNYYGFQPFGPDSDIAKWTTLPGFLIAGFLVGLGAKLAGGCTSGHGLCGIPRLSLRSVVVVCMFLLAGIGISTYATHFGLSSLMTNSARTTDLFIYDHRITAFIVLAIGIFLPIFSLIFQIAYNKKQMNRSLFIDTVLLFIIGMLFAAGLLVSGMSRRINILQFLQIGKNWDPSLLVVLGCGVGINLISFGIMRKRGVSLNGNKVFNPQFKDQIVDWKVVVGGFCFGLGWGLAGLCPGPFYVLFSVFTVPIQVIWGIGFITGAIAGSKLAEKHDSSKLSKDRQPVIIKRD